MEVKVVSSAGRSNRISKDHYRKTQNSLSKKRAQHTINESMCAISKVMSHLIPKGRHFADDVNLLEFTIEYLKQMADFQRGVGLCAEETKTFLKHHVFDRSKIIALFQKIEQRIDYISKAEFIGKNNIDTVDGISKRQNILNQVEESTTGVLLDLSMKHNRLQDEKGCSYNSTTIHSFCNNLKKREILDKIRKKILDKRRMSTNHKVEIQNEIMWRPWRY